MNLQTITRGLTKLTGRTGIRIQKYSPEILLVVGISGAIGATVMACKATLRAEEVLFEPAREKQAKIQEAIAETEAHPGEIEYLPADIAKDKAIIFVQTAVDFVKLYGPAMTLGAVSIVCIVGSHGIMRKRNLALVAAYKAVEQSFMKYRKRVVEELGEQTDYMYKNGLRAEQISDVEIDENGKKQKVKKDKLVPNGTDDPSEYARYFGPGCGGWSDQREYNIMFLRSTQNYMNDLLQIRGHVFLNEIYDRLGIKRSEAGVVVGWVLGKGGDDYIDFGIFDGGTNLKPGKYVAEDGSILLDFNVDGTIWDKI